MEAAERRRRVLPRRKPLSDCTNSHPPPSSHSSSSKPNPSSSSTFKKSPTKCKSSSATRSSRHLDNASNPSSPPPPVVSTPSAPLRTSSLKGTIDLEASEPISIVYSRRPTSKKGKDKEKAVAFPVSSTPILKISNSWEKSDGVEGANPPAAKALTVPCRKKQRAVPSEQDAFKDPLLQDFIEKQKAYFKVIDEFKLPEEEVESINELD